jgi:hypothetical protein
MAEIPLVGYAATKLARKKRAVHPSVTEVEVADSPGALPPATVTAKNVGQIAAAAGPLGPLPPVKGRGGDSVFMASAGAGKPSETAEKVAAIREDAIVPVRGGEETIEEANTRSVIPAAVSQGRGIKPRVKKSMKQYRVGDLKSHDSALMLAKELLEVKSLAVVELLVQTMRENIADVDQQIKGIAALGHYASIGNEHQLERSGQAHQQMYDYDIISPEMLRIQQSGAIAAVMNAVTAHTASRRLVLRACWALEQMTAPIDNQRQFQFQGGEALLATLGAIYIDDEEIMFSIKKISTPSKKGKTWNALQCCGKGYCAVM